MVSGRATVATSAEGFAAQAMTNLAEPGSLGVRELGTCFQVGLQDSVFGDQIFVPRQQLLIHRTRDVSQDPRPIHNGSLPRRSAMASLIAPNKADPVGTTIPAEENWLSSRQWQ